MISESGKVSSLNPARIPFIHPCYRLKMAKPKKQKFPYLLGSKWTAQQRTMGWRHFQVTNRKNEGKLVFAELVASCDPAVRFWVNASVLKNRQLWQAGWQTLDQIIDAQEKIDGIS